MGAVHARILVSLPEVELAGIAGQTAARAEPLSLCSSDLRRLLLSPSQMVTNAHASGCRRPRRATYCSCPLWRIIFRTVASLIFGVLRRFMQSRWRGLRA
jgi:hypothetical protein